MTELRLLNNPFVEEFVTGENKITASYFFGNTNDAMQVPAVATNTNASIGHLYLLKTATISWAFSSAFSEAFIGRSDQGLGVKLGWGLPRVPHLEVGFTEHNNSLASAFEGYGPNREIQQPLGAFGNNM